MPKHKSNLQNAIATKKEKTPHVINAKMNKLVPMTAGPKIIVIG